MRGGPDGRTTARWRGKSGLHKATVPGNARPGQPEGKRHRKQTALQSVRGSHGVRVKRWGKSPPRDGQPDRHGKPHREQCRIGTASRAGLGPAVRVGSTSLLATAGPDEWSSPGQPGTESGLQALRAFFSLNDLSRVHARNQVAPKARRRASPGRPPARRYAAPTPAIPPRTETATTAPPRSPSPAPAAPASRPPCRRLRRCNSRHRASCPA